MSWYGSSGYVVVKGGHPSGNDYPAFRGDTITELPERVGLVLQRKGPTGTALKAANSADVDTFLDAHTGTAQLDRIAWRGRTIAAARAVICPVTFIDQVRIESDSRISYVPVDDAP